MQFLDHTQILFCLHKFGLDVLMQVASMGREMKRSMALGKNGKFVIIVFICTCQVL